jgi:hypothetical protein
LALHYFEIFFRKDHPFNLEVSSFLRLLCGRFYELEPVVSTDALSVNVLSGNVLAGYVLSTEIFFSVKYEYTFFYRLFVL